MNLSNFYKSDKWLSFRENLMNERTNANGEIICAYCGKPILRRFDCIAHHKTELTEDNVADVKISLNPENVELIHFRCHNMIHERFEGFKQEVFLVYGSPCAGKTTWVKSVANPDDLILDLDRIWESLCLSDRYHKPKRIKTTVFIVRDCILDSIRTRTGQWRTAFVIGGYPLRTDRDRLCDMLNAEPIFIEASEEECLNRCETEEWKEYVREWFDTYTA